MPALISMIAFFESASSFGNKNNLIFFSFNSLFIINSSNSFLAMSFISLSLSVSLVNFSRSFLFFSKFKYFFALSIISLRSEYSFDFKANNFLSIFPEDNSASRFLCLKINSSTFFT